MADKEFGDSFGEDFDQVGGDADWGENWDLAGPMEYQSPGVMSRIGTNLIAPFQMAGAAISDPMGAAETISRLSTPGSAAQFLMEDPARLDMLGHGAASTAGGMAGFAAGGPPGAVLGAAGGDALYSGGRNLAEWLAGRNAPYSAEDIGNQALADVATGGIMALPGAVFNAARNFRTKTPVDFTDPATAAAHRFATERGYFPPEAGTPTLLSNQGVDNLKLAQRWAQDDGALAGRLGVPEAGTDRARIPAEKIRKATPKIFATRIHDGGDIFNPVTGKFEGPPSKNLTADTLVTRAEQAKKVSMEYRSQMLSDLDDAMSQINRTTDIKIPGIKSEDLSAMLEPLRKHAEELKLSKATLPGGISASEEIASALKDLDAIHNDIYGKPVPPQFKGTTDAFDKRVHGLGPKGEITLTQAQGMVNNMNRIQRALGAFDETTLAQISNSIPSAMANKGLVGVYGEIHDALQGVMAQKIDDITRASNLHGKIDSKGIQGLKDGRYSKDVYENLNSTYGAMQTFYDEADAYATKARETLAMRRQMSIAPSPGENIKLQRPKAMVVDELNSLLNRFGKEQPTGQFLTDETALNRIDSLGQGMRDIETLRNLELKLGDPVAFELKTLLEGPGVTLPSAGSIILSNPPQPVYFPRDPEHLNENVVDSVGGALPPEDAAAVLPAIKDAVSVGDPVKISKTMGAILANYPEVRAQFSPSRIGAVSEYAGIIADPVEKMAFKEALGMNVRSGKQKDIVAAAKFASALNSDTPFTSVPASLRVKPSPVPSGAAQLSPLAAFSGTPGFAGTPQPPIPQQGISGPGLEPDLLMLQGLGIV